MSENIHTLLCFLTAFFAVFLGSMSVLLGSVYATLPPSSRATRLGYSVLTMSLAACANLYALIELLTMPC